MALLRAPRQGMSAWPRLASWLAIVALLAGLAALAPRARAAAITVSTTADEDNGSLGGGAGISLREALLYSASGDTITLPAGTYSLSIPGANEDQGRRGDLDVLAGKALTLGGAGAASTRISASFPDTGSSPRDRVLDIQPGAALAISGVTISGGITGSSGGGIRNQGTLEASGVVVRGNFAVVVEDDLISGVNGGGIANQRGAQATISDSAILSNSSNRSGGGLFNDADSTMTLDRVTVANNVTTRENGGGVANEGALAVSNSTLSGNSANRSGGGLYNNGSATVINATITGNIANADRRIGGNGGGAFNNAAAVGALTLRNTIVAGNQDLASPPGDGVEQSIFPDLNAETPNTIVGNSSNLIGSRDGINNSSSVGTPGEGDIVDTNILLGELAADDETTLIHLPQPASPAVDAAETARCTTAPVSGRDQRSSPRPADGDDDNSAVCDIGAVEIRAALAVSLGVAALPSGGELDFGSTVRATPVTRTLTIANAGEAVLLLGAPAVSGDYTIVAPLGDSSLDPGQSTTLDVRLDATAIGAANGELTIASNDPEAATYELALVGQVTPQPAQLALADEDGALAPGDLVDFGTTTVGSPVAVQFTISNTGDEPLELGSITPPAGFALTAGPSDTSVASDETATFTVSLVALLPGAYSGELAIPSNDPASPFAVVLSGVVQGLPGSPAEIVVTDLSAGQEVADGGSVDFGPALVGETLQRTFRISNIGDDPLSVAAPTVTGGFSIVGGFTPATLASGESVDLTIAANTGSAGTKSGSVSFANGDANENPFNFSLSAAVSAEPAEIAVSEGSTPIADNSGSVSFGSTLVGAPVVKTFTVRNDGGSSLTLGSPSLPAGFSLVGVFPATVAPGATATFQVRLTAAAVGEYSGQISFSTNVAGANPFNFAVSGQVEPEPPQIEVSTGETMIAAGESVDIGSTRLRNPLRRTFTIRNTGGSELRIDSINVPPGYARNPAVVTADVLAPGATTSFELVLDAEAEGIFDGQVTVRTNDPDTPDFGFVVRGSVGPIMLYLPAIFE